MSLRAYSTDDVVAGTPISSEWTLIRQDHRQNVYIKPWAPGDGLTCSHASKQRVRNCGKPVAAELRVTERHSHVGSATPGGGWYRDKHSRYIICANHLAAHFGINPGEVNLEAEKRARELVVANHWDEYKEALERHVTSLQEGALAKMPEELRKAILGSAAVPS